MHNQITASTGIDQESHLSHDNTYSSESWVDMNSFHQPTTMPDYGTGYGFMPSMSSHGLPSESLNRMLPPPPQAMHSQPAHPPQLPMLMMPPQPQWPSMLTNPNNYVAPHSAPPVAIPPSAAPLKTSKPHSPQTSQPRKTLTDEVRRNMCLYAEQNPGAKQTDIGARFGVERSTVSKVLRHKEKYLSKDPEERSSSPIKRTGKGKGSDVEKTLSNWVLKQQRAGLTVARDEINEKIRLFASTTPGGDSLLKVYNGAWIEKFMLRHNLKPSKLVRRASETNISDSVRASDSPWLAPSQPPGVISPASPSSHISPSPLSAQRSDDEKEGGISFVDFGPDRVYKHSNSQSTASLSSAFTDTATPSFSSTTISPTASFNFSPDPNVGGFVTGDQSRQLPPHGLPGPGFQRPRSQTFPTLDLEYMNQQQSTEPVTPKFQVPSTAPPSALEPSSSTEHTSPSFGFGQGIASPQLRHSSSNSSIAGRSTTTPITTSAVGSSPSSPTQEDARRAADTLLSFIQNASGFVDQNEYLALMRLTEKLRIHQSQLTKSAVHVMGGLSQIPEGDSEMPNAPPTTTSVEPTMTA
ncbi:hypothetical protein VTK26DRAFT_2623 [Humicola hyalothermophila]